MCARTRLDDDFHGNDLAKESKKEKMTEKEEKRRRQSTGKPVCRAFAFRGAQRRALIAVRDAPHVTQVHIRLRHECVPVSAYVRPWNAMSMSRDPLPFSFFFPLLYSRVAPCIQTIAHYRSQKSKRV